MTHRFAPLAGLLLLGLAWGATLPLTKVAVSTGQGHFGLIFWQLVVVIAVMGFVSLFQQTTQRVSRHHFPLLLTVSLAGTILPNSASYIAAVHVPSGVMSIVMSLVPMSALPIALLWRAEQFEWRRLLGLVFGAIAVVLLVGPDSGLPDPTKAIFVLVAAIGTIFYGFEGNYVARFGLGGLTAVQVLLHSSLLGVVIVGVLAIGSGQFYNPISVWGIAETALLAASFLHTIAYVGYIILVGRTGPVFAAQISYLITMFGIVFAMVFLGERYAGYTWLALGIMMLGLFLVQPKTSTQEQT